MTSMTLSRLALAALAIVALAGFCVDDPSVAGPMTRAEIISYLTQARCPDGKPPTECANPVPQTVNDAMAWRKHDYGIEGGYLAQDAVLSADASYVINTYSFAPFRTFDASLGDGGEVYVIDGNGRVTAPITQDGGRPGLQYFCGHDGWVLFDRETPAGSWRGGIAHIAISTTKDTCPPIGYALTRWRKENLVVPFTILGAKKNLTLSCIVNEHYNGSSVANAVSMEQAVFCKGWGRVWWAGYSPTGAGWQTFAHRFPDGIPWAAPPERPDFKMQDVRLQTNIRAVSGADCKVGDFGWPPADYRP